MFRRTGTDTKLIIHLFYEGKTEIDYLQKFSRQYNNLVKVMEEKPPHHTNPSKITKKAIGFIKKAAEIFNEDETPREVWVMFDHDEKISEVKKAFKLINEYNNRSKKVVELKYAYTCPCFEVWALLHYDIPVSKIPHNRRDAQSLLKNKYMKKYDHDGNICFDFKELTEQRYKKAVGKAKDWENTVEGNIIMASRYTTVHHLTERIRKFLKKNS